MKPKSPTTPAGLPRLSALLDELHEDGIDATSDTGRRALELWLGNPTGKLCSHGGCQNELRRFEVLNSTLGGRRPECWPHTLVHVQRIEAAAAAKSTFAR